MKHSILKQIVYRFIKETNGFCSLDKENSLFNLYWCPKNICDVLTFPSYVILKYYYPLTDGKIYQLVESLELIIERYFFMIYQNEIIWIIEKNFDETHLKEFFIFSFNKKNKTFLKTIRDIVLFIFNKEKKNPLRYIANICFCILKDYSDIFDEKKQYNSVFSKLNQRIKKDILQLKILEYD